MAGTDVFINTTQAVPMTGGIAQGLTAFAGGAQATFTNGVQNTGLVLGAINTVSTVATAGDSGTLAADLGPGQSVIVRNEAAINSMNVFPPVGGTINGAAANAAFALAAGKTGMFVCLDQGLTWVAILSA